MDEWEKAHLEIIENGSLGFCVAYYGGKFMVVILKKTIFFLLHVLNFCDIDVI